MFQHSDFGFEKLFRIIQNNLTKHNSMKKFVLLALFLSFLFIFSSSALAKIPTGECCRLGHSEDCPQTNGDNYICDYSTEPSCENESLGECYLVGPYEEKPKSSLEKFQNDLEQPGMNLAKYTAGGINGEFFGTFGAIVNTLTLNLIGPVRPTGSNNIGGGAVGAMGKAMAMMYQNPPASSVEYIAYMGEKAGFIDKAYAQGVGFRGFSPLIKVWSAMRNTAYLFFAFIFIVIGLMVIFRVKIDPRTVVAVQTALPRIVIAILLVTFSYAIVGLLIDVMNVVIGIFVWLFHTAGLIDVPKTTISEIQTNNVLAIVFKMFGGEFLCSIPVAGSLVCQATKTGPGWAISEIIRGSLSGVAGATVWLGSLVLGNSIIELIFSVALAVSIFKLLFGLIMAYVSIIISVIMAPLQIAFNAIPNWNTFKAWLMNLLASLSVFPTVAAMLILGAALTGKGGGLGVNEFPGMTETGWRPPLIGGGSAGSQEPIMLLIGYGIILMTPGMVDQVKKLFKVPPAEMPAIGAAVGAGARPVTGTAGLGVSGAREWGAESLEARAKAAPTPRKESLFGIGAKLIRPGGR